jgi:hypothetical protein
VVQFDAQIFLSIWRQLLKHEAKVVRQPEAKNLFELIAFVDKWKSEFDQEPLPSRVALSSIPSASFNRKNCTLLTSDGKAVSPIV